MNTSRYIVTVSPRYPAEGGSSHKFTVDTSDALQRDYFGETAEQIATSAAADYCDSGSVTVIRADGGERASVGR